MSSFFIRRDCTGRCIWPSLNRRSEGSSREGGAGAEQTCCSVFMAQPFVICYNKERRIRCMSGENSGLLGQLERYRDSACYPFHMPGH